MSLNKEELLKEMRLKTETVEISPGKEVIVSEIGAADYIKLWTDPASNTDGTVDMAKFTPRLIAFCVVDEKGAKVFGEADIPALERSSSVIFDKICDAARKLNGLEGAATKN